MKVRRWLVVLSLVLTAALVIACAPTHTLGSVTSDNRAAIPTAAALAPSTNESYQGSAPGASGVVDTTGSTDPALALATSPQQMIIRTVNMTILMDDVEKGELDLSSLITTYKGYVADSRLWRENELTYATITLRVPAESLDQLLTVIRSKAVRIDSETITTEDVSQEYVDLDARLRNLQATEKELLDLLTTIRERTTDAEQVLAVYREITSIRGEIEQIQGRQQYLDRMTTLATVQVQINPTATPPTVVEEGNWNPLVIINTALRGLVSILQGAYEVLVVIVLNVLPVLILIALPIVVIILIVRASIRRKARKQKQTPPA